MNFRFLFLALFLIGVTTKLAAQSVPFGSSYYVESSHSTTSDGIQSWTAVSITSPSGQNYSDDTHNGLDAPDGSSGHDITLNEAGTWQVYYTSGYDAPQSGSSSVSPFGTVTVQDPAPANTAPTIGWTSTPGTVASGQAYTVSAHAYDADGNLTQVNLWKDGAPFAFAGGGNGTDGDSGNPTSDAGPTTVTFTAQAVDSAGATSATISQTVTINAPPPVNQPPTIVWNTTPGTVASGQSYIVSAHGHDQDGNLTQVNVWKNGTPFAFAGGGNGTDGDSGNPTSDTGPTTITFTAQAVDGSGAASATISQTVTIDAPPAVTASISASPTSATAPGSTTITWSSANATSVSVSGNGVSGSTTSGSQAVSGLSAGTYSYTITAQGSGGPATQTATFTVTAPANSAPTIAWNTTPGTVASGQSYTISAHGHDADGNLAQVNVWKNGVPFAFAGGGNGTDGDSGNPTSDTGPTTVTFTAQAVDGSGATSAAISQTVTVNAPPAVTASISASPTSATAPGSTTITWSSANATSVSVSGDGVSSTATSGSQVISGLPAGTYTSTITAQGSGGPATQTATFTVNAPANSAPTIAWNTTPGTVASGAAYSISAHGHDVDGNLTQVNVWKNGTPFAFAGGGNGTDGDSGNPTSDTGPTAVTFTAQAVDAAGASSATISQTVTISAPPTVTASISASPTSATAPGSATITWSSANAASASVSGNGISSSATSGSQTVSGLSAGTYTYTITAQGFGGPATQTATVTVTAAPNSAPTIAWNTAPGTVASGQSYTISAHGHDADGNLTNVNVWRDGVPYAFAGGGNGSDHDSGNPSTDTGPLSIIYTAQAVDAAGASSATISQTVTISAPPSVTGAISASPTTATAPGATTISWSTSNATTVSVSGPGLNRTAASGSQSVSGLAAGTYTYTLTVQGTGGPITRTATVTVLGINRTVAASVSPAGTGSVTGAGTYVEGSSATLTAKPDATHVFTGWIGDLSSATNPLTFTVGAQNYNVVANFALRTFTVTASVSPAGAGSVSGAGNYTIGSTATLSATPDATHVFTGWTGDITSSANPVSFAVNNPTNVTANFAAASFALTTAATGGGTVTPGGTYPSGTTVTVTASPDATHWFTGWTGDVGGSATTMAVTLDRAKFVQANFTGKTPQSIVFDAPGDHGVTSPPFTLSATASSGLPVSFSLLSGPAILTGNSVQVTAAGPVTLQANQPGDALFLPAAPVNQTFNVIAAATLKYRGESRTLLRGETTHDAPPFVLEKP